MIEREANPDFVNSFLDYTITILNKSPNTVKEYNYDKFLENFNGVKVGLCYSEFTQDELLHDDFDNNVDVLLTERYSLYTAKQTFYFYS